MSLRLDRCHILVRQLLVTVLAQVGLVVAIGAQPLPTPHNTDGYECPPGCNVVVVSGFGWSQPPA